MLPLLSLAAADLLDMRQRKISRVAPFVHGSHARARGFAPQCICVHQKQTNAVATGVNERSFVKKFVRENLQRIIIECSNIRCSSKNDCGKSVDVSPILFCLYLGENCEFFYAVCFVYLLRFCRTWWHKNLNFEKIDVMALFAWAGSI